MNLLKNLRRPFEFIHFFQKYWLSACCMPDIYSQCMGGGVKESACNAGDLGLTPGSGRSPGEGHGNPLQYSCLENSMDRGAGGLQSMGLQNPDMTERLTHILT